jgi:hypothetical protein
MRGTINPLNTFLAAAGLLGLPFLSNHIEELYNAICVYPYDHTTSKSVERLKSRTQSVASPILKCQARGGRLV